MKYLLFILLNAVLSMTADAQVFYKAKKPVKVYEQEIDRRERTLIADSIPFSGIRVIDSRYDTTDIGINVDGYISIKGPDGRVSLQNFFDACFNSLYTPGKDTLLIKVEKLMTQTDVVTEKNFIVSAGYLSCKLYIGSGDTYRYYDSDTALTSEVYDYRNIHKYGKRWSLQNWAWNLLRLCERLFRKRFILTDNIIDKTGKVYTTEEIRQDGLIKRIKPILTTTALKQGYYRNFTEFINNSPSITVEEMGRIKSLSPGELSRDTTDKIKKMAGEADGDYWGYCDGNIIFIRFGKNLYQLERRDCNFYMAATLDAVRRQNNREGWNLLIGLTGVGLDIATKEVPGFEGFNTIAMPNIPMLILSLNGNPVAGLVLDWDTGEINY